MRFHLAQVNLACARVLFNLTVRDSIEALDAFTVKQSFSPASMPLER